jgi:hypothetical protein
MTERDEWIVYWRSAGMPRAAIARAFNLSRARVDQVVNADLAARRRQLGVLQRALKEGSPGLRGCLIALAMGYEQNSGSPGEPVSAASRQPAGTSAPLRQGAIEAPFRG